MFTTEATHKPLKSSETAASEMSGEVDEAGATIIGDNEAEAGKDVDNIVAINRSLIKFRISIS
ncbi:MAG TPA: hypothetical protein VIO64_12355 [Pseudobacteroides sp.]|uniref:hypothetical protein n=1 Tax=Pseudobacteroides sp. TaxID=1968840 RepID=UPI002F930BB4